MAVLQPHPDRTPVVTLKTGLTMQPWSDWFRDLRSRLEDVAAQVVALAAQVLVNLTAFLVQHNADGTHKTITTPGVTFPAVQVPSANPNTLDDFEEGLVSPLTSATIVYSASALNYQKSGSWVFVTGFVSFPATADPTQATITNLPFTCENSNQARGGCVSHLTGAGILVGLSVSNGSTTVLFFNPATAAALPNSAMSGAAVFFDFKYRATQ